MRKISFPIIFLLLAGVLSAADLDLGQFIHSAYKAGKRVITLPDGDVYINSKVCKLGPEIRDLEIKGGKNTRLIIRQFEELFYFSGCKNVKVSNFAVDHEPLLFTQGTITKVENANYYFKLHDGYPRMEKHFLNRHPYFFNAKNRKFKWPNSLKTGYCKGIRIIDKDSGVIEFSKPASGITKGDFVVLNYRKATAFKIDDLASDIVLENLTVYNAGGGVISRRAGGKVTVRNFHIKPGPVPKGAKEPRLLATCADGFNFASSRKGPTIENCSVTAIGDDSINLHGVPLPVRKLDENGDPVIFLPIHTKDHIKIFRKGDKVLVLNPGNFAVKETLELDKVELIPLKLEDLDVLKKYFRSPKLNSIICFRFLFKEKTHKIKSGDYLDVPAANCPDFVIRGNRFFNHRARGIRMMAGSGIIEKNRISHLENAAITLGPEYAYWGESGWVNNVIVRDNVIDGVCLAASGWFGDAYTPGAICTFIRNDAKLPIYPGNKNIIIENNSIKNSALSGIFLVGADGVTVRNNLLKNTAFRKEARTGRKYNIKYVPQAIGSCGSVNLKIENNKIIPEEKPEKEIRKTVPQKQKTIYVDNLKGSDRNDGSASKPVASIEKGLALLKNSGRLEVKANPGKPYVRAYPGKTGRNLLVKVSGTPENPVVINGNGATISGLSVVPAKYWKKESGDIWSLPFWPMSNWYRRSGNPDHWMTDLPVFFINGKAGIIAKSRPEMEKTPDSFWWSRKEQKLYCRLPQGADLAGTKIEVPANSGFYISGSYVNVRNFTCIYSWNDGFDTVGNIRQAVYSNCTAVNSCGQAFSAHGNGEVLYEDCIAIGCGSSGSCNVNNTLSVYRRCIFYKNVFEAGVFNSDCAESCFYDCLILDNKHVEQLLVHRNATLTFFNCFIRSSNIAAALCGVSRGRINLINCTLEGGKTLVDFEQRNNGALLLENCLLGKTAAELLPQKVSPGQLVLKNSASIIPGIKNLRHEKDFTQNALGLTQSEKYGAKLDPAVQKNFQSCRSL